MRLHHALRIRGAGPDLEIAVAGQLHRRGPALPVIFVLRLLQRGALPARAEVGGDVDLLHGEIAGPRGAAQFQLLGAGGELAPFAGLVMIERTGIDSRMRKFAGSPLSPGTIGLMAVR